MVKAFAHTLRVYCMPDTNAMYFTDPIDTSQVMSSPETYDLSMDELDNADVRGVVDNSPSPCMDVYFLGTTLSIVQRCCLVVLYNYT